HEIAGVIGRCHEEYHPPECECDRNRDPETPVRYRSPLHAAHPFRLLRAQAPALVAIPAISTIASSLRIIPFFCRCLFGLINDGKLTAIELPPEPPEQDTDQEPGQLSDIDIERSNTDRDQVRSRSEDTADNIILDGHL